jgi:hypothetical protein
MMTDHSRTSYRGRSEQTGFTFGVSLFTFFLFRIVQKFVSKFPSVIFCLLAEGTPCIWISSVFIPINCIPCKNGNLQSQEQLLLCFLSFKGIERGTITGIQEKSNYTLTHTGISQRRPQNVEFGGNWDSKPCERIPLQ